MTTNSDAIKVSSFVGFFFIYIKNRKNNKNASLPPIFIFRVFHCSKAVVDVSNI